MLEDFGEKNATPPFHLSSVNMLNPLMLEFLFCLEKKCMCQC